MIDRFIEWLFTLPDWQFGLIAGGLMGLIAAAAIAVKAFCG